MVKLRDYQEECLAKIWKEICYDNKALAVMSTGGGKTEVFKALILKCIETKPDIRIVVLFNKVKLLKQIAERLSDKIDVGIYCATLNRKDDKKILVGSVQSLPDQMDIDLIIIDECHNMNDEEGDYFDFVNKCKQLNPNLKIVGFTATDFNSRGHIHGREKFWPEPCYKKGLKFFIDNGHLVTPICRQPDFLFDTSKLRTIAGEYSSSDIQLITDDLSFVREQCIDALNRMSGRKKVVWFCSNIKHCEDVKGILNGLGEEAVCIHSKQTKEQQRIATESFEGRDIISRARHLSFVSIVSEGYDYPPIDCVVLMRPTRSPTYYVQTCGRALRPFAEKQDALILDYARVVHELGPLTNPIIGKPSRGKRQEAAQKVCPNCRAYLPTAVRTCGHCGFEFPQNVSEKLTLTPDEDASLLEKKSFTMEVKDVTVSNHISKAGNACLRFAYEPSSIMFQPISEYFTQNGYGLVRLSLRQAELQVEEPFPGNFIVNRKPSHIEFCYDGKYPRINKLFFEKEISNVAT